MRGIQRKPITNQDTIAELERVRDQNGGILAPEAVVKAARSESSPLHDYFEWHDGTAAESWRLHQARNLIRVVVHVEGEKADPVRAYVSLASDRTGDESGGYRHVIDVVRDPSMRQQLLTEALAEIASLERKYRNLTELAQVFAEARRVHRLMPGDQATPATAA